MAAYSPIYSLTRLPTLEEKAQFFTENFSKINRVIMSQAIHTVVVHRLVSSAVRKIEATDG